MSHISFQVLIKCGFFMPPNLGLKSQTITKYLNITNIPRSMLGSSTPHLLVQ